MTRLLLLAGRCRNEIAALQNVHLSDTVDPILADQKKKEIKATLLPPRYGKSDRIVGRAHTHLKNKKDAHLHILHGVHAEEITPRREYYSGNN